jgi:hypothetical protein
MPSLLYIHGFLSSPVSAKARVTGNWLAQHRPGYRFICPFLTPYPDRTRRQLESIVETSPGGPDDPLYLMGSSLGGYWSTWLAEKYDLKAVLINPLVDIGSFEHDIINKPLQNYHTDDTYRLSESDVEGFSAVYIDKLSRPENFLLLLQTGDEVLDYRLALEKYSGSRKIIEEGGDHSFTNLESKLALAMEFLELHDAGAE